MKYLRFQLMAALLCLVAIAQAQTNVLRVEAVETPAGKALILPIVMENQSDVTGVQFDLDVPFELAVDDESNVIVNMSKTRANGHTVVTRKMGSNYNYHYYSSLMLYQMMKPSTINAMPFCKSNINQLVAPKCVYIRYAIIK